MNTNYSMSYQGSISIVALIGICFVLLIAVVILAKRYSDIRQELVSCKHQCFTLNQRLNKIYSTQAAWKAYTEKNLCDSIIEISETTKNQ